jgi:hypothetical protein
MGERHTAMIERIVRRVEEHTEEWRQRDAARAAEAEANRPSRSSREEPTWHSWWCRTLPCSPPWPFSSSPPVRCSLTTQPQSVALTSSPLAAEDRLRRSYLPADCGRCYTPYGVRRVLDYRTGATPTLCVRSPRDRRGNFSVRSHASGVVVAIDARLGPRRPLQRRPTTRRRARNR